MTTSLPGGFTFAEDPAKAAPDARLIWRADLDPGTLAVTAVPAEARDPDAIDPATLAPWLTLVTGTDGREHAVLSDGLRHIRLDVVSGTLGDGPVILGYCLSGTVSAAPKILPLRRLIALAGERRFLSSLFPADPRVARWIEALRVHDALTEGASQREIAQVLYGAERVASDWHDGSDFLRSRVRRLAAEARRLAKGGYRFLMRGEG
ncbi:DUF2285 domain-containing protein [Novosphingobium naphthalenivorans]|uniref:DUF2285 domain-containing protein n=1 Tax=Novosphingobium naphthalenivorans TaxID=273168 RepID=UPI000830ED75|nr:DUF2285 domain-containing protein [Novosphingobium naphthalenivorans]